MTTDNESSQDLQGEARTGRADEKVRARRSSVYLGLGSNLGDREANLHEAIRRIEGLGLEVVRASSIYETEPVGYADQPWFLNQVIEATVALELTLDADDERIAPGKVMPGSDPLLVSQFCLNDLLSALQEIEREMGRERTIANGPRVIDIDILIYEETEGFFCLKRSAENNSSGGICDPPRLILPHPRMHERRFVLEPLCEIAPDLIHPRLKKSSRELLAALDDPSTVRVYERGEQYQNS